MARPRLEPTRGAVSNSKICLAVFVGVALGLIVSLIQLGGESSHFLSNLKTGQDASDWAQKNEFDSGRRQLDGGRKLEERVAELEEERDSLAQKHDVAQRQRENLAAEAAVLRKKLQAALQEDVSKVAAEGGKVQQREIDDLKKQLEKARETYRQPARVKKEERPVVGPPGSIKAERTFPTIVPDPSTNLELAKILEKVAVGRELIVAVSNNNIRPMLQTWFENVRRTGATNYLVVCLDDAIAEFCEENGVPYYRKTLEIPDSQKNAGSNHAISGLKFHILREFMLLGYSVFLSDVDIVFLQNPFKYLYRDCDVEGMTDGHDNITAYGYDDVSDDPKMGWSRYAHTMRIWVFNSGLFYIRPTAASIELLDRVADRLSKENAWDQAVFNEELFRPSRPGYDGLHASKRVLDYLLFMNSKVLFTRVRRSWELESIKPVTIHVNYHPDKYERMLAVERYYVNGEKGALDGFPDGSER